MLPPRKNHFAIGECGAAACDVGRVGTTGGFDVDIVSKEFIVAPRNPLLTKEGVAPPRKPDRASREGAPGGSLAPKLYGASDHPICGFS